MKISAIKVRNLINRKNITRAITDKEFRKDVNGTWVTQDNRSDHIYVRPSDWSGIHPYDHEKESKRNLNLSVELVTKLSEEGMICFHPINYHQSITGKYFQCKTADFWVMKD
jgi:hypothetical protein